MTVNRCARGFLFFFALMITSVANVLLLPVDADGDESTPPVIITFKFVTTPATPIPNLHSLDRKSVV